MCWLWLIMVNGQILISKLFQFRTSMSFYSFFFHCWQSFGGRFSGIALYSKASSSLGQTLITWTLEIALTHLHTGCTVITHDMLSLACNILVFVSCTLQSCTYFMLLPEKLPSSFGLPCAFLNFIIFLVNLHSILLIRGSQTFFNQGPPLWQKINQGPPHICS